MKKNILTIVIILFMVLLPVPPSPGEEVFTWSDCREVAKKNHPDLQSALEKIRQAKAGVGISRSPLLPVIDASADIATSKSAANPKIPGSTGRRTDSYSYGITAKQLLFDGTKAIQDLKSAQKRMEVSDFDYQMTSSSVRLSLRNAFVQLLRSQESLDLKKEIARIRKKNFELVQMRYRAGVEHRGSLLTAEANLAQADFEVAQAVRSISLARYNLVKEMGLKEFKPFMVRGDLQVAGVEKNKPDLAALAGINPALQRAIRQRQAAEYDLASAETDYAPKVYGQLGADRTGTSWPPGGTEWNAGVQMSLNLFQGGKSYYQTSKAEAYRRQLIADERSARDAVLLTLEQKWNNLQNNIDTVRVQSKFLKAAEERARIADAQYGLGSIVFDNWIIIQDTLVNAKKSFLEAEISALTSEAEWIQAKGGMLNYDD